MIVFFLVFPVRISIHFFVFWITNTMYLCVLFACSVSVFAVLDSSMEDKNAKIINSTHKKKYVNPRFSRKPNDDKTKQSKSVLAAQINEKKKTSLSRFPRKINKYELRVLQQ